MATFTTEQCRDLKVLVQFVRVYCQARHADAPRAPAELPEELVALIDRHSVAGCFHHVKAYREERLLMMFHDAFDGSELLMADGAGISGAGILRPARRIPPSRVERK